MVTAEVGLGAEKGIRIVEELRSSLRGSVLTRVDPGYEETRSLWNGMIDVWPAVVVVPVDEADVQTAVRVAASSGLPLSIKGGGHNVAGKALSENGIVIDMREMRAVRVDPEYRRAYVQGGALWSDVDAATARFGLATTGGVISSTGVAGLTLGGGIGWLVGKHGMSIDNLVSVTVVTADGELVQASAQSNADLFWALRGGGGNFGVVTELEFALHERGDVLGGLLVYPVESAPEVLEVYREFTRTAPEELGLYAEPTVDPESGQPVFVLVFFWPGAEATGREILAELTSLATPLANLVEMVPYPAFQQMFDPVFPHGTRYYWKGTLVSSLEPELVEVIARNIAELPSPNSTCVIEWYRGAMNRVESSATAFANREAQYQILIIGSWQSADDDAAVVDWVRRFQAEVAPFGLGQGFLNFNSVESADSNAVIRQSFGANWDRLVAIKRQIDPNNMFRGNHNILPN